MELNNNSLRKHLCLRGQYDVYKEQVFENVKTGQSWNCLKHLGWALHPEYILQKLVMNKVPHKNDEKPLVVQHISEWKKVILLVCCET